MDKETKKKIQTWGLSARESVLDLLVKVPELDDHFDENDLTGACALASYTLLHKLRAENINSKLTIGRWKGARGEHVWVNYLNENKPLIIDITATQFNLKNEVHITHNTNKKYLYYTPQPKLKQHFALWDLQNPFLYKVKWHNEYCSIDLSDAGESLLYKK